MVYYLLLLLFSGFIVPNKDVEVISMPNNSVIDKGNYVQIRNSNCVWEFSKNKHAFTKLAGTPPGYQVNTTNLDIYFGFSWSLDENFNTEGAIKLRRQKEKYNIKKYDFIEIYRYVIYSGKSATIMINEKANNNVQITYNTSSQDKVDKIINGCLEQIHLGQEK